MKPKPAIRLETGGIGLDEAGRGPLAGPVVVAAVWLPETFDVLGLDDSKKLTPARREEAAERIRGEAVYAIEIVAVDEVDRLNILWASMEGMRRAWSRVWPQVPAGTVAYVDGNRVPPGVEGPQCAVIRGDGTMASIAAASILAKTTRDALMVQYGSEYPEYGFERHFGYATPEHLAAIRRHGPCPLHRRTFSPVRELVLQPCLAFDA